MVESCDLTDEQYEIADAIGEVFEADEERTWTPSELARKAKVSTNDVYPVLGWMANHQFASSYGNGCRRRYGPRQRHLYR